MSGVIKRAAARPMAEARQLYLEDAGSHGKTFTDLIEVPASEVENYKAWP